VGHFGGLGWIVDLSHDLSHSDWDTSALAPRDLFPQPATDCETRTCQWSLSHAWGNGYRDTFPTEVRCSQTEQEFPGRQVVIAGTVGI
jgi:hypothetical protein